MPGPRPKPKSLKILDGGGGHHKDNRKLLKPGKSTPRCPKWLTTDAKREWRRIVPELEALGYLTELDRAPLSVLCQSIADFKNATQMIESEGMFFTTEKGYVQKHPLLSAKEEAAKRIKSFCAEYGLTPGARGRIEFPKASGPKESKARGILD